MGHRKGGREGGMVSRKGYIPERGDAVWIILDPQAGHEQAGRRPALVLSPSAYNRKVGLALFCPITSLADQVKSLDWRARHAEFVDRLPDAEVRGILSLVMALLSERRCGDALSAAAASGFRFGP